MTRALGLLLLLLLLVLLQEALAQHSSQRAITSLAKRLKRFSQQQQSKKQKEEHEEYFLAGENIFRPDTAEFIMLQGALVGLVVILVASQLEKRILHRKKMMRQESSFEGGECVVHHLYIPSYVQLTHYFLHIHR